jgi:hypothetical protein
MITLFLAAFPAAMPPEGGVWGRAEGRQVT